MTKFHTITHTHWDREWYFTKEETKVLLRQHMLDLFSFLEEHPEAIYVLDGQSVMIDDFLQLAPEFKEELKKYIASGNILVGPWYTQTDLMLVRGESIVRNLYYGLKKAKEYTDNPMLVGYAPDTFGHNAQMPQIYQKFGINSSYFWRGVSKQKSQSSNFNWQALDGTKIFAHSLAAGYQGAKYLINDKEDIQQRLGTIEKKYNHYQVQSPILVMNGHDQMPVQKDLFDIFETYNTTHPENKIYNSDFEIYQEIVEAQGGLATIKGELYDAEFTRVHKTISSTRMDIKLLNTYVEDRIYNHLEPLSVIASSYDIPYPHALIEKVLKLLFGTHAHDSIGGCNTDKVNQSILQRLIDARELVDNQIDVTLRQIGLYFEKKGFDAFVVNVLPYELKQQKIEINLQTLDKDFKIIQENDMTVDYQILEQELIDMGTIDRQILARRLDIKRYETVALLDVKEIPGLSIIPLKVVRDEKAIATNLNDKNSSIIENNFYKIKLHDGLNLTIKETGKEIENFIFIENNGDAGDGYDYSPLKSDWILSEEDFEFVECLELNKGILQESMKLKFKMFLPKNEASRINREKDIEQLYIIDIRLNKNEPEIGISIQVENLVQDQRTRLGVKTTTKTNEIISDTQYGENIRPSINPNLKIWEQENWVEKPVSIEHFESYVSLNRQNTFYAKGLKEYEHLDDKVYFTLFRSFGYMGRSDLINRPGRASGMAVKTPLNQLLNKSFTFNFWLNYYEEENPGKTSKNILTKMLTYQTKEFNRFNINEVNQNKKVSEFTLPMLSLDDIVITTVKCNEQDELIIRGYNSGNKKHVIKLPNQWEVSDLAEQHSSNVNELTIDTFEIFTIKNVNKVK